MIKYINIIYSYCKLFRNLRALIYSENYDNILIKEIINNIKNAGAVAIKLGQWSIPKLEIVYDNKLWVKESEELYDCCNIHSIKYTKELYKNTFFKDLDEDYIVEEVLGSGSIGQVYKVLNKNTNQHEVIKVKHPDIEKELWLFKIIYKVLYFFNSKKINYIFPFNIDTFIVDFEKQVNFINEVNNIIFFKDKYKENKCISIPDIKLASNSIIVMSYEDSIKVDNKLLTQYDKTKVINLLYLFIRTNEIILNYNHGDLHKGNWGYYKNKLVVYDYGFCYSSNKEELEIVKLIPKTFDAENFRTLEENRENLRKIVNGMIIGKKTDVLKKNIVKLVDDTFKNCKTFYAEESEYMLMIVIKFCKENGQKINSKLLNFFILFNQCQALYTQSGVISMGRSSERLFKGRYMDIVVFCKTNNVFLEFAHHLVDRMNETSLERAEIFDTVNYEKDMNDKLVELLKKDI